MQFNHLNYSLGFELNGADCGDERSQMSWMKLMLFWLPKSGGVGVMLQNQALIQWYQQLMMLASKAKEELGEHSTSDSNIVEIGCSVGEFGTGIGSVGLDQCEGDADMGSDDYGNCANSGDVDESDIGCDYDEGDGDYCDNGVGGCNDDEGDVVMMVAVVMMKILFVMVMMVAVVMMKILFVMMVMMMMKVIVFVMVAAVENMI
eukprot:Em0002g977a